MKKLAASAAATALLGAPMSAAAQSFFTLPPEIDREMAYVASEEAYLASVACDETGMYCVAVGGGSRTPLPLLF